MPDAIDQEIQAIRTLLQALEPLSARARRSALEYVLKRLEIRLEAVVDEAKSGDAGGTTHKPDPTLTIPALSQPAGAVIHIKQFKEQKKPRSDAEMAALVAYYLAKVVAPADRKESIAREDVETYFNIAEYPLPKKPEYTLPNAKNAGYFKVLGKGQYALNPVGQNLIAYSLPRDGAKAAADRTTRKARKPRTDSKRVRK